MQGALAVAIAPQVARNPPYETPFSTQRRKLQIEFLHYKIAFLGSKFAFFAHHNPHHASVSMQASIFEHRGGRGIFAVASALRDAESGACHTG